MGAEKSDRVDHGFELNLNKAVKAAVNDLGGKHTPGQASLWEILDHVKANLQPVKEDPDFFQKLGNGWKTPTDKI